MKPQLAQRKALTLAVAREVAAAVEAEATKNNLAIAVAILDDGGNMVYFERMDEAQIGSVEVAQAKAHCAVAFKRSSKVFQDSVAAGNRHIMSLPGVIAVDGGLPLTVDGKVIGAIGVSGGSSAQNGVIAAGAVHALAKIVAP